MHRRTVHRRISALALVTALALVGPRPAAATGFGLLDHLGSGSLWSAVTGAPEGLWETLTGWFGRSEKPAPPDGVLKSSGTFDPNGNPVVTSAQPVDDAH